MIVNVRSEVVLFAGCLFDFLLQLDASLAVALEVLGQFVDLIALVLDLFVQGLQLLLDPLVPLLFGCELRASTLFRI